MRERSGETAAKPYMGAIPSGQHLESALSSSTALCKSCQGYRLRITADSMVKQLEQPASAQWHMAMQQDTLMC